MIALKVIPYLVTIGLALFFAFWERKLKRLLTDNLVDPQPQLVSDIDSFYEIRRDLRRERILRTLPRPALLQLRIVISLKVLFAVALVVEVVFLQR